MRLLADVQSRLAKFARKAYRDGFLQTQVRGSIAYQIQALRDKFGLSQEQFAQKTGKKQSVISRLENPEKSLPSVQTLIDIAAANDVALVVRFVSYPEFLAYSSSMSPEDLQPATVFESLEAAVTAPRERVQGEAFIKQPFSGTDASVIETRALH